MKPSTLADALDAAQFGGKAASLAKSLRAGLPVPPGFALSPASVEAVFDADTGALKDLRLAFNGLAGPCAVRSSAIGEVCTARVRMLSVLVWRTRAAPASRAASMTWTVPWKLT